MSPVNTHVEHNKQSDGRTDSHQKDGQPALIATPNTKYVDSVDDRKDQEGRWNNFRRNLGHYNHHRYPP